MVFGPIGKPKQQASGTETLASSGEMARRVRNAAELLIADLQAAQRDTNGWASQEQGFALVDTALSRCLVQLRETGLWGRENEAPSNALWKIAGPWLEVGSLEHRARFKPRGYAGDYLMLSQICDEYVCNHPLGRLLDRFFQSQAAPQAVRSRTEQIASAVFSHCLLSSTKPYRIVSVGSGPARDVEQAVRMLAERRQREVAVVLLDLDPEALEFASRRLKVLLKSDQVDCIRENLFRLPQRRKVDLFPGPADFLICSGLFDYLEDDPAAAMLAWFWEQLAPGGQIVVGNFAPHCPSRTYMEWIGSWYLHYRTSEDLAQLAVKATIPKASWSIGAERLGVDLFLNVAKDP